jgi:hypothetical protein
MHLLTEWLKGHTLLYTFILFLISALFSLYSQDIRRFLHEWPRTKAKALKTRRDAAIRRLELLSLLYNNSYQLLLYFATQFVQMIFGWLIWAAILTVIALFSKTQVSRGVVFGVFAGLFIGRLQEIRGVLVQLTRYDRSVATLQQQASN